MIRRRTLLKQAGAGALVLASPRLLVRSSLASGLTLANSVTFTQGVYQKVYASLLRIDANLLGNAKYPVLTTQRIFLQIPIKLLGYMLEGYPGGMTLLSLTDAQGEPRFFVRILPPSSLYGSSKYGQAIQIYAALNGSPALGQSFSYVAPDMLSPNGGKTDFYSLNLALNIIPGSTPARWLPEILTINQTTGAIKVAVSGYYTNMLATEMAASQVPPIAFPIPVRVDAIGNPLVLSMGPPIQSSTGVRGGYLPVGGAASIYDSLWAEVGNTLLHLNPNQVDIGSTISKFTEATASQAITVGINAAVAANNTAEQVVDQLNRDYQNYLLNKTSYAASLAAAQNSIQAMHASINAVLATIGAEAALAEAKGNLIAAQSYAQETQTILSMSTTETTIVKAQNALYATYDALANAVTASAAAIAPGTMASVAATTNTVVSSGSPSASLILNGNATQATIISGGTTVNVAASQSGSYLENQVGSDTSMTSPASSEYEDVTQSPDDSYTPTSTDIPLAQGTYFYTPP